MFMATRHKFLVYSFLPSETNVCFLLNLLGIIKLDDFKRMNAGGF